MTNLSYQGTAQGLQEFLHSKTMEVTQSKDYLNNPFKAGTLDHQEYEEFKNSHEKFMIMHQGDNMEPSV